MDTTMELIMVNVVEEEGFLIKYYLYENELDGRPSFSIECRCGEEGTLLPDVTSERSRAREIFELFVRCRVTPISAHDVMEEILS